MKKGKALREGVEKNTLKKNKIKKSREEDFHNHYCLYSILIPIFPMYIVMYNIILYINTHYVH